MEPSENITKLVTGNSDSKASEGKTDLKNDQDSREQYKKIKLLWALISSSNSVPDYHLEKSFKALQKRIKFSEIRRSLYSYSRYAAIILLVVGITSVVLNLTGNLSFNNKSELIYTEVIADFGQVSKVVLPDKSIVLLNSGSSLKYNNEYSIDNRNLILNGQAFFDIQKNKKLPVVLNAKDVEVKVLGTKFYVNAYPEENQVDIFLESGNVELRVHKREHDKYLMVPGQIAIYDLINDSMKISDGNMNEFTSWKDGKLVFKDEPLDRVLRILERKFNVEFIRNTPKISKSSFTATFRNESLVEILNYISYSCKIDYKIDEPLTNTKQIVVLN
ncbi:FecR family protein [Sunxiuqinia sp. A32]|uniref:FecR family protein n=1 Tax=Sunxiuqinia sp. A32 TaxID=3461496 RepID=UPI004045C192